LWERLAELEADATREAISKRFDWGVAIICPSCKQEASRFKDGVCFPCVANLAYRAERRAKLVKASKKHGLWVFPKKKVRPVY
jgi:predicted amidophosphoribosyltransferase